MAKCTLQIITKEDVSNAQGISSFSSQSQSVYYDKTITYKTVFLSRFYLFWGNVFIHLIQTCLIIFIFVIFYQFLFPVYAINYKIVKQTYVLKAKLTLQQLLFPMLCMVVPIPELSCQSVTVTFSS